VLDGSGSMFGNTGKWENAITSIKGMVSSFTNPKTRFSLVTFYGTTSPGLATTWLHLTGNRTLTTSRINECAANPPVNQGTFIGKGLQQAYTEMSGFVGTIPTVFLVTDGVTSDESTAFSVATQIRALGANIFAIGILPEITIDFLNKIANQPPSTYVRTVNDSQLSYSSLVNDLVEAACIQVDSVTPDAVCIGDTIRVNITGKGFNRNQDLTALKCRFGTYTTRATYLSPTRLSCECPYVNVSKDLYLEIQISSTAYTQSNVTFHFNSCEPEKPFDWLLLAYIAAGVIPFLIFLCWFFYPLMVGAARKKESQQPESLNQDPAALPPGKKWADVDTSKYVWSREGGSARPMPVKWGELGPTAGAGHLEASGYKEGVDEPLLEGQEKPGCCARFCFSCHFCCSSCYSRCANCRPHRA